jgi:hypothetical protein
VGFISLDVSDATGVSKLNSDLGGSGLVVKDAGNTVLPRLKVGTMVLVVPNKLGWLFSVSLF